MCQGKIAGYQGKQNIIKAFREKIQSIQEVLGAYTDIDILPRTIDTR